MSAGLPLFQLKWKLKAAVSHTAEKNLFLQQNVVSHVEEHELVN